jgi:sigma-B regulation protein RsbU (phosphoserine phosphatase)
MGKLGFLRGGAFIISNDFTKIEEIVVKGQIDKNVILEHIEELSRLPIFEEKFHIKFSSNILLVTLKLTDNRFVLLCFVSRLKKADYLPDEQHYLSLVLNMTANALDITINYENLYKTNIELQRRNQLLTTIFEINRDFSLYLSKDQISSHFKYRIFGQLLVTRFALYYEENGKIEEILNNLSGEISTEFIDFCLSLDNLLIVEIDRKKIPERFHSFLSMNEIQIILPLIYHNQTRGVLILGKKYINETFTKEDINFIQALGNTFTIAIENCRLVNEEIRKKQIEKELQLALEIQQNLLPQKIPTFERVELWGFTTPAKIVGGDYFDIIQSDRQFLYLAMADVAGKGIPASLLMANVQSALRLLVSLDLSLQQIVNYINSIIYHNTTPEKFITFFLGKLNLETLCLEYINAGHNPPILFQKQQKKIKNLTIGGLFLGFIDSPLDYQVGCEILGKDDFLLIYTDGVTECKNSLEEEFGVGRLVEFILNNSHKTAKSFCENLFNQIVSYCETKELGDDVSLLALKIK